MNYHKMELTNYDEYINELIAINAKFEKFEKYNNCDVLYSCVTQPSFKFENGYPHYLIRYEMIVNIGSFINDTSVISNETNNLNAYYFFPDYFVCHPHTIKLTKCTNIEAIEAIEAIEPIKDAEKSQSIESLTVCDYKNKLLDGTWCTSCLGEFNLDNLHYLMFDTMKFVRIPIPSIISIEKIVIKIDVNNLDTLHDIQNFLLSDIDKINILRNKIHTINEKIRIYTEKLLVKKDLNQQILDRMMMERGCNWDEYLGMINYFDNLINESN